MFLRPADGKQRFLGRPARVPQRDRLPGVEFDPLARELAGHKVGQREIHVVAAGQNVVAHGRAFEDELAFFFGYANQGEVGGAAAHVADEQRVSQGQLLPPPLALIGQPGIHGRLRLLEQHQAFRQPGRQRCGARQLAGTGVERSRHGEHDLLLAERRFRMRCVPSSDQVLEIPLGGRERRDLGHFFRSVPRQDRLAAIDPAVAEPALGGGHRAHRHFGRLPAGNLADSPALAALPREIEVAGLGFLRRAQVAERRQQRPVLDRAGRNELRNLEQRDHRLLGPQRRKGERAVRGAQVDAYDELSRHTYRS